MSQATDPVIRDAIKLRDGLLECAREFRVYGGKSRHASGRELAEMDAKVCENAAVMLQKLGTEVTRLRLCIGHFDYGRMDRSDLRRATQNWNDSPAAELPS